MQKEATVVPSMHLGSMHACEHCPHCDVLLLSALLCLQGDHGEQRVWQDSCVQGLESALLNIYRECQGCPTQVWLWPSHHSQGRFKPLVWHLTEPRVLAVLTQSWQMYDLQLYKAEWSFFLIVYFWAQLSKTFLSAFDFGCSQWINFAAPCSLRVSMKM